MQEYIKKTSGSSHNHPSSSASGNNTTTLIISNNEIEGIIKIVKSLEDSDLFLKGVTETVQNEVKEQKGGFLSMLLGILGASLLRNLLTGKRIYRAGKGKGINRAGEGIVRAGYRRPLPFFSHNNLNGFLMPPHPLTNFKIQKYYQNKLRFNGVFSRDNLPERSSTEIKDGAYIINLDEYSDIGTHWVALYANNDDVTYFDCFGVEHIPKEIKAFINRSLSIVLRPPLRVSTNICRIQA